MPERSDRLRGPEKDVQRDHDGGSDLPLRCLRAAAIHSFLALLRAGITLRGRTGGGYPHGFLERAYVTLRVTDPTKVLHVCSGSVTVGITLDVREIVRPRIVGDATALPFRNASFEWIMADPPYTRDYAENLYGSKARYPAPSKIMSEAARVLRGGGRVGMLHFLVPPAFGSPLDLIGVWGVTTGLGYQIRAWTVYEKRHSGLGL